MPAHVPKRTRMPAAEPTERAHEFTEVNSGYDLARAIFEAQRCLRCQDPVCVDGCPVTIPIREFLLEVQRGNLSAAAKLVQDANPLPAICGRVCPQENQCELECTLGKRFQPVAIGHLERYVADWQREQGEKQEPVEPWRDERVAMVGSGPAGLVAAGILADLGYLVTVFEGLHAPGGVLRYGIPEFRLPKDILDSEIEALERRGVEIKCNVVVGKTIKLEDLRGRLGYQAVFIGTGAGLPRFLGIPGENLNGVLTANEFLTRINLMHAYEFPTYDTPIRIGGRVAVIGAGNTAMDAIRCALRLGAKDAMIVYRRSQKEMTARVEEHEHAIEEGIEFNWLTNPVEVLGNEDGYVRGLACERMELGEPDESGRARPVPIPDSRFEIELDNVILAIGTSPNPLLVKTAEGLATTSWGGVIVDEETGETSMPGVFAGGDAVTGASTVIEAAGAGKRAAYAIHNLLSGEGEPAPGREAEKREPAGKGAASGDDGRVASNGKRARAAL